MLAELNNLTTDQLRKSIVGSKNIPEHVAIIMDGNGRWAKKRFLPRVAGHRAGRQSVRKVVKSAVQTGISFLTLYTFSQENWKRPEAEVKALFLFLEEVLSTEIDELNKQNVRLVVTGEIDSIPEKTKVAIENSIEVLSKNNGLVLNLALSYGGRAEIVNAAKRVTGAILQGEYSIDDIDENIISTNMYSPEIPDPDLVIRTSGEYRLSNFLIWQAAYSEMYFTDVLWPDFGDRELLLAIADYQDRDRRFGGLKIESARKSTTDKGNNVLSASFWKDKLAGIK